MIQEQFVSYDIALKLKELGFTGVTFTWYKQDKTLEENIICFNGVKFWNIKDCEEIAAPLYQQVFEFFRYNNNLHHDIVHQESSSQEWYDAYVEGEKIDEFGTYRQAEIACINKLIELVHDK